MNAPTAAAAIAAPKPMLEVLALDAIVPSKTHIQELRRARFDKKALQDLADSIKVVGVLQPVVARPLGLAGKYELVAGERRWLAAKIAGLTEIRASVCVLTHEQVLEIQLVENLQREGLHELEEAEGYEELMKLKGINADQVAGMVGKSRSYVYARTKLLALCPELRKAFYAGELDASTALLLARIPPHDLQRKALKELAEQREYGEIHSFRDAQEFIRANYMLRLKQAPFDQNDAQLLPKAGSCAACPKRTGNQRDLFGDVKDADVCTDPKCFDEKRQAHFAKARKLLEAKGEKVIHGDAAKKLLPHWEDGGDHLYGGYKKLTDRTYAGGRDQQVAAALGKDYKPVLLQHPLTGKIILVATEQAIAKASGAKPGTKSSAAVGYDYGAARARAKAKGPDVDEMLTERLAQLIHKNAPKSFGKAWLYHLAAEFYEKLSLRDDEAVAKAWAWPASSFNAGYRSRLPGQVAKLGERDLVLFMFHLIFAVGPYTRDGVLKLFSIKEPQVREQIIKERKDAAKKARAEAKAKKAAKTPVTKVNAAIDKRVAKAKKKKKK